jgi:hypothetical protein
MEVRFDPIWNSEMKKICSKCGEEKDVGEFWNSKSTPDGLQYECKKCIKEYQHGEKYKKTCKERYLKNKEKYLEKNKERRFANKAAKREYDVAYRERNKDKISKDLQERYLKDKEKYLERNKKYRLANKKSIKVQRREYREKNKKDPIKRLRLLVSKSIHKALVRNLGGKDGYSIMQFLPYTIQQLKEHLEKQFEVWMNWDNYGAYVRGGETKWHIDHIIPQSFFLYDSMEHPSFLKCWALENLRPLEAVENISKSDKLIGVGNV